MIPQETSSPRIADTGRRIAAFFIDYFLFTFLLMGAMFMFIGSAFGGPSSPSGIMASMGSAWVVFGVGFLCYFAKDILGASPGKWAMGVMVRSAQNPAEEAPKSKLFLRNISIMLWPVEFIVLLNNKQGQRLGDQWFDTVVVENPNKPKRLVRISPLILVAVGLIITMIIGIGSIMKDTDAYKTAISHIEKNEQVLTATGGITGYGFMPAGNINITNGYGTAQLVITVKGNTNDIQVYTHLEKQPFIDEWTLLELTTDTQ